MIRTWDPQIRNLVLYPTELPGLHKTREFYQTKTVSVSLYSSVYSTILPPAETSAPRIINQKLRRIIDEDEAYCGVGRNFVYSNVQRPGIGSGP